MHREKGSPDNHVLYRTRDDEDFAIIVARRRRTARKHLKGIRGDGREAASVSVTKRRKTKVSCYSTSSTTCMMVLGSILVFAVAGRTHGFGYNAEEDSDENE